MKQFDRFISWYYVRHFFGTRCPDYDEDCHCCKSWKEHDELMKLLDVDLPSEFR